MSFNPIIPEIYQIEATNACNFTCDFCPRSVVNRPPVNLDLNLAKTISERDLAGSYFVEFQLSGEPLLHPDLGTIISYFKGKVLTGLSTNGALIHKHIPAIRTLDYLTISIDSFDSYEDLRKGGNLHQLWDNINMLMKVRPSSLVVDLQIVELETHNPTWKKDLEELTKVVSDKGWENDVNIRTVKDCFTDKRTDCTELCINPWASVTVHSDGDVVPCCFAFDKKIVYGNLNEKSLEEIWKTSEVLEDLRHQHIVKFYNDMCKSCHMRSPYFLHQKIFNDSIARKILDK